MNVPMPTGDVRARVATPWVAFTVAAHPVTSCRVMAKPAKVGPVCYSALGRGRDRVGGGSQGKLKLGLGAKTLWGKSRRPCDTDRNLACQRLSEAWGWKQLASSELAPCDSALGLLAGLQQNQDQTEVDPGETQGTEEWGN